MVTPIILLAILVVPFWFATVITRDSEKSRVYGVVGLSLMFVFAGFGHFIMADSMSKLLHPGIPFPILIIYFTGLLELAVAAGLLVPKYRSMFGWVAIALFILFLPANIYGAYTKAELGGHSWGLSYLLLRVPLQLVFIFWAYWFCVRKNKKSAEFSQ